MKLMLPLLLFAAVRICALEIGSKNCPIALPFAS